MAQLLAKKVIKMKGMIPPEKLGGDEKVFRKLMGMLKQRGIQIKESEKILRKHLELGAAPESVKTP